MNRDRWALCERVDIPDLDHPEQVYLRRWNLIVTPWASLKLHHIRRPDGDRAMHCHPWNFATLILRGGYFEETPHPVQPRLDDWTILVRHRRPRRIYLHRATDLHRIAHVGRNGAWTVVLCGPRKRRWGFSEQPGVWQAWDSYIEGRAAAQHLAPGQFVIRGRR